MGLFGDILGAVGNVASGAFDKLKEFNDNVEQAKQKYESKDDNKLFDIYKGERSIVNKTAIIKVLKDRGWERDQIHQVVQIDKEMEKYL